VGQLPARGAVLEMVDRLANDPGRPHLEQVRAEDRESAQQEGEAVALEVRKEVS
jgi:hypothetical protein